MKKKIKNVIIAAITSLILLLILFQFTNITQFKQIASTLTLKTIFIAGTMYLITYLLRTLRSFLLLNSRISFVKLFHITSVHEMLAQILPLRLGELTFITLTRKTKRINVHTGVSAYFIFRCLDLLTLVIIFLIATGFHQPIVSTTFTILIITFGCCLTSIFLFSWHQPHKLLKITQKIPEQPKFLKKIKNHAKTILKSFYSIKINTSLMIITTKN